MKTRAMWEKEKRPEACSYKAMPLSLVACTVSRLVTCFGPHRWAGVRHQPRRKWRCVASLKIHRCCSLGCQHLARLGWTSALGRSILMRRFLREAHHRRRRCVCDRRQQGLLPNKTQIRIIINRIRTEKHYERKRERRPEDADHQAWAGTSHRPLLQHRRRTAGHTHNRRHTRAKQALHRSQPNKTQIRINYNRMKTIRTRERRLTLNTIWSLIVSFERERDIVREREKTSAGGAGAWGGTGGGGGGAEGSSS